MSRKKASVECPQDNEIKRCDWLTKDRLYIEYHDLEWGKPEHNGQRLFEMLCLEGQQAGLSWITILKKRDNYRKHFQNFDPFKISKYTDKDIKRLQTESGIVRHKGKIEAIINNSKCFIEMEKNKEDFSQFIWSFVNNSPVLNDWSHSKDVPSETAESIALSKALKKRGFKFIGPTVCYAFMQACGLVNDHIVSCYLRKH